MTRAQVLHNLLRLGPLEPIAALEICGWRVDEFDAAVKQAIDQGLIRKARHTNQHSTRLEAIGESRG